MIFAPTTLHGVTTITMERHEDARGTFARIFCDCEFRDAGLPTQFIQQSCSTNRRAGTLRGMHWQRAPHAEGKLVRCVRGAIHDVVADLRPRSPSFLRWEAFLLEGHGDLMVYVPPGCAHGFLTLADDSEVVYQMTERYAPDHAAGFRYDDPAFGIDWPAAPAVIAERDLHWPRFDPAGGEPG